MCKKDTRFEYLLRILTIVFTLRFGNLIVDMFEKVYKMFQDT